MDARTHSGDAAGDGQKSYAQILKSTAVIGGSSVINIVFAAVRNKAIALLLGPDGVGLMGLFNTIADLVQTVASLGVQASGVRQVAEAVGTGDNDRIARTAIVLRRVSLALGLLGALLLAGLSLPIAQFTFGDHGHAAGLVVLSLAVFLKLVSAGQTALLQGLRRISDLAWINIVGAIAGTVISVPIIYYLGERGIVPSLVTVAAATLAISWWFSRKVSLASPATTLTQTRRETKVLLKLGFAFMASAVLTSGAAYAIRLIILRLGGFEAAGLYQAAWALGGLYAGFILQAMGTDFYPRLTAVCEDNGACNRLVNEQAQISLLLAGPGLMATLTAAPLIMVVFYSSEFHAAADLLRWICLGMMLRIASWPMGFIVVAKGRQNIFFWTEVAATAVHVGLAWLLVTLFGLTGAGVAFFGLYVWHTLVIYLIVRQMSGFRWSAVNLRLGALFLAASAIVFAVFYLLPLAQAVAVGAAVSVACGFYSLRMLLKLVPRESLPLGHWLPQWI